MVLHIDWQQFSLYEFSIGANDVIKKIMVIFLLFGNLLPSLRNIYDFIFTSLKPKKKKKRIIIFLCANCSLNCASFKCDDPMRWFLKTCNSNLYCIFKPHRMKYSHERTTKCIFNGHGLTPEVGIVFVLKVEGPGSSHDRLETLETS